MSDPVVVAMIVSIPATITVLLQISTIINGSRMAKEAVRHAKNASNAASTAAKFADEARCAAEKLLENHGPRR